MYYQEMAWEVPDQPGVVRGLLQEIPREGYAGWYCEYMGQTANPRYECSNAMVGIGENMQFGAPDLRMKNFKLDGPGFKCTVDQADEYDIAVCLKPLPIEDMGEPAKGEYRYSPDDENLIS